MLSTNRLQQFGFVSEIKGCNYSRTEIHLDTLYIYSLLALCSVTPMPTVLPQIMKQFSVGFQLITGRLTRLRLTIQ